MRSWTLSKISNKISLRAVAGGAEIIVGTIFTMAAEETGAEVGRGVDVAEDEPEEVAEERPLVKNYLRRSCT